MNHQSRYLIRKLIIIEKIEYKKNGPVIKNDWSFLFERSDKIESESV